MRGARVDRHRARVGALASVLALSSGGCGAMLNGLQMNVDLPRTSPDVTYVVDGVTVAPEAKSASLSNLSPHTVLAVDKEGKTAQAQLEPKVVHVLPIVLDGLWCLTILGVAAPISDALMGTWKTLEPSKVELVPTTPVPTWADLSFEAVSAGAATK